MQYSVDEMFLDLTRNDGGEDFEHFGRRLHTHEMAITGLTVGVGVGVGMGPTKTLANSAQWASKEWNQFRGACSDTPVIRNALQPCFGISRIRKSGAGPCANSTVSHVFRLSSSRWHLLFSLFWLTHHLKIGHAAGPVPVSDTHRREAPWRGASAFLSAHRRMRKMRFFTVTAPAKSSARRPMARAI